MAIRKVLPALLTLIALLTACSSIFPEKTNPSPADNPQTALPPDTDALSKTRSVKIAVTAEGMYRIPLDDLGWNETAAQTLTLTRRGIPIPYEVQTGPDGTAIIFYGQASESRYTPQNIYILSQSEAPGARIYAQENASTAGAAADYVLSTLHFEENQIYKPTAADGITWHWSRIVAPQSETIEFDLPALADAPAALRVSIWGATSAPTSPAHHIRVNINGQTAAEAAWDGQTWQLISAELPTGTLKQGMNSIEIQATGETDTLVDIVHLDWVEVDYPKPADSLSGYEIFRSPKGAIQLRNWEGTRSLYEVGEPAEISRLLFPPEGGDSPVFQADPEKRYLAIAADGFFSPNSIQPLRLEPDLLASPGADYLAIGDPGLLEPLAPLLETRQAQGLSTLAVPLAAVYDQFNHGVAEPEAIRAFLRYATENWPVPPRYVLLVGDANYDFYGYQTPLQNNFVPTFLVTTGYGGETGSDVMIAQLDDDLYPDLAIGRIPARTPEQAAVFVEKTLAYEQTAPAAPWNRSIFAIADGSETAFAGDARHFLEQFPAEYQTELLAPEDGAQGVNEQIAARLDDGFFLAAYFGHGSVTLWGKDALLTAEEAANLQNGGNLPIMLNFTCLTGLFTQPDLPSLAESLLLNPEGGVVAILAPTSPTLPSDQGFLSDAFAQALLDDALPRLGDVTLTAWRQVPVERAGAKDVMLTFLLFGDPALVLPH